MRRAAFLLVLLTACSGTDVQWLYAPPPDAGDGIDAADAAPEALDDTSNDSAPGDSGEAGGEDGYALHDAGGTDSVADAAVDVFVSQDASCVLAPSFACGVGEATPPLQYCVYMQGVSSYTLATTPASCASGCAAYSCVCVVPTMPCAVVDCNDSMGQVNVTCH